MQACSEPPDPRLLRRRDQDPSSVLVVGVRTWARRPWTGAETFGAAPSGRRVLATDGCASNSSNPACCSCAVWALGGPRGVAVVMSGPTGRTCSS